MADKGYGQYCPISRAVEVLGERWSLLIVRDLVCGTTRFNELSRGLPGLSRSLLSKRLRQLERSGIVEHVGDEYLLTAAGKDLEPIIMGLGEWGARWQFDEPREDELDPELLMWWLHERVDTARLPDRRVVFEFSFTDVSRRFWIVVDASGPSVCAYDPGYDVDATITTELPVLLKVFLGKVEWSTVVRDGTLRASGDLRIVRDLGSVLQLSVVAPMVAALR